MEIVKFIGLDISTSIIGVSLLDSKGNLIDLQNINLKKIKCLFEKSNLVKEYFVKLIESYNFEDNILIFIEEAFQSFSKGFSSARTLSQLNKFNGIVSYIIYEQFKVKPAYINVNSARKVLQIKIDKKLKNTKEQVFIWVRGQVDYEWPEKIISRGINKGVVKFEDSCYDMSDAYVISKAGIYLNDLQSSTKA